MKSEQTRENSCTTGDALILVDLQNDFLPGGALAVPEGNQVIEVANRLQPLFELVIATRDWHPASHVSFATSHPGRSPGEVITCEGTEQVLWPVHCVQDSVGAQLSSQLDSRPNRCEVLKGEDRLIDSYSGFCDNHRRRQTTLDALLRHHGITRLFVMGLATEYCVKFTALDAVKLGYDTYLIRDGCRGVNAFNGGTERAIRSMREAGVSVINSEQVKTLRGETIESHSLAAPDDTLLARTEHLQLIRRGRWDFVRRARGTGVVAIAAVTPDRRLLFVEQYRPPVQSRVIELPAGLVGDQASSEEEDPEEAARRELLEETGYQAATVRCLLTAASSSGLTDEQTTFVLATDLELVGPGGGDPSEAIEVHAVPLEDVDLWLKSQIARGRLIDARLPTALYLLREKW